MFKTSLVNVRPTEKTPWIGATPTNNTIRINQAAAVLMGINYNDVLAGTAFITGGQVNFNGEVAVAFVLVNDPDSTDCAKLASPTKKTSGSLQFASGGLHDALNGDNENNILWKVTQRVNLDDSGNATALEDGEEATDYEGWVVEYYETRAPGTTTGSGKSSSNGSAPVAAGMDDDFDADDDII